MEAASHKTTFRRRLTALVMPIAFQQFMLAAVNAMDAMMLGAIHQDAMSAVSLATQVSFVESLFLLAMTLGLSTMAAQYWGKGDLESVERVFAYVMKVTTAVSFCFFAAGLLCPEFLMRLLTNESALIAGGTQYLQAAAPSFLLTGISQVYLCALKNTDRARTASLISATCALGDVALNALLIFGFLGFPRLEIVGAALTTSITRGAEVLWCMLATRPGSSVKLRIRWIFSKATHLVRDFWHYTLPVLGNELVWGVGFTMYSVILGHMGSDAVAANAIASVAKNLVVCWCLGLGSGGAIMLGNELGAGRLDVARVYGGRLCRIAIVGGAAAGGVLLAASPVILMLVDLSPAALEYLKWMLVMCAVYMVGKSVNCTTIAGIFCAGGDTQFGFKCDFVTMWFITVPLGFLAAFWWKLPVLAVYAIVNMDEIIKLPAVYRHYRKYLWLKNITQEE